MKVDGSNPQFSDVMNWLTAGYFFSIPPSWEDPYFQLEQASDGLGGGINTNWDNSRAQMESIGRRLTATLICVGLSIACSNDDDLCDVGAGKRCE
ncbi:MAG TPA: hypothetical protein VFU04_04810, partial [Solirubrobacterales bacterium]|nr:hypothetical protein [Solirubrobacterales bacterium]